MPVIAIVYIPKLEQAYWLDITRYLADHEDFIEDGPFTVKVSQNNVFDVRNFNLFHYSLNKYLNSYGDDKFFGRALKLLVDSKSVENRYDAIKSLFSFHRNKLETWYFLVTRFCFETDLKLQMALIYAYRHLLSHGDIWWHPGNIIESSISDEARQLIPNYFGYNEASKLLGQLGEGGISRGTVGYDVYLILKMLPDRIDYLKKIILTDDTPDEKRYWTAICLINEFQYYDLERAINFANSMFVNFPKSEFSEMFLEIKRSLKEFSIIDFTG